MSSNKSKKYRPPLPGRSYTIEELPEPISCARTSAIDGRIIHDPITHRVIDHTLGDYLFVQGIGSLAECEAIVHDLENLFRRYQFKVVEADGSAVRP